MIKRKEIIERAVTGDLFFSSVDDQGFATGVSSKAEADDINEWLKNATPSQRTKAIDGISTISGVTSEAEELRRGIEKLTNDRDVNLDAANLMHDLLDSVDARDSLAFCEVDEAYKDGYKAALNDIILNIDTDNGVITIMGIELSSRSQSRYMGGIHGLAEAIKEKIHKLGK